MSINVYDRLQCFNILICQYGIVYYGIRLIILWGVKVHRWSYIDKSVIFIWKPNDFDPCEIYDLEKLHKQVSS